MAGKKKIVVALSGGVDSSVAALRLQQQGFEVVGATLKMFLPQALAQLSEKTCVAANDDAIKALAARMKIEHHFIDASEFFKEKILYFCAQAYAGGITPNPCVYCNRLLKFGILIDFARNISAAGLATGHYVRLVDKGSHKLIRRGSDPGRDQSYFLYQLSRDQLGFLHFPLGDMDKSSVRAIAEDNKLENARKKDSQDACFSIPGESFPESLRKTFGLPAQPGNFVDMDGKILGRHRGVHLYTIGQRKGLNIALGVPAYVQKIDLESKNIVLTTNRDDLLSNSLLLDNINWQVSKPCFPLDCEVQIRYRSKAVRAMVEEQSDGKLKVEFCSPQRAATPGQAAVFYQDNIMLGGGIIL